MPNLACCKPYTNLDNQEYRIFLEIGIVLPQCYYLYYGSLHILNVLSLLPSLLTQYYYLCYDSLHVLKVYSQCTIFISQERGWDGFIDLCKA